MSKSSLKKPASLPSKVENESSTEPKAHWTENVHECSVCIGPEGTLNLHVSGGSDKGEFAYFEDLVQKDITYLSGHLETGDVILEIQGQKVAGFTQRDVVAWLNHCCKNGNPVRIRVARGGLLKKDLRLHLNSRFPKGSADYELQNIVRDNLYLRTVPCTTRPPREGEINGVDYTFLTPEEFLNLERSGNLLESGIYEGNLYGTPLPENVCLFNTNCPCVNVLPLHPCNHYGTPKPPKECPVFTARTGNIITSNIPGIHPSSEGKRRRNRSSVEAMTAKSGESTNSGNFSQSGSNVTESSQCTSEVPAESQKNDINKSVKYNLCEEEPLPENWEKAYTDKGEPYFIDHNTGTSQWLDPRLSKNKKNAAECNEDELPYGWEKIDDPHYGTYYIDHVNKKTQYENPVLQAKKASDCLNENQKNSTLWSEENVNASERGSLADSESNTVSKPSESSFPSHHSSSGQNGSGQNEKVSSHSSSVYAHGRGPHHPPYVFTRNPSELTGKMVQTSLVKSSRGLGFTIVGRDDDDIEEFLQIKGIVPNGPAWQDGKLKTGDVLVYINDICVLGYSHHDVVSLFQSIPPGETVHLQVCQGYPLPFDPDDPNTEIVTTLAVSNNGANVPDANSSYRSCLGSIDSTDSQTRSAKSMPDLSAKPPSLSQRHNSADLLNSESGDQSSSVHDLCHMPTKPEYLSVEIIKGKAGFGFTIADSVYGQKVKKILDRPRCQHLREGDILIEINGQNIRGLAHTDVVQILKECPCGESANITIQRGGLTRVTKMKSADDIGVRRSASNNSSHSFSALPNRAADGYGSAMYRSKTPTADLYSSRDKEPIHVSRPKTPLVDTRYWAKPHISESLINSSDPDDKRFNHMQNADCVSNRSDSHPFSRNSEYSRQLHMPSQSTENGAGNRPRYQTQWRPDVGPLMQSSYNVAERTGANPTWYTSLGKLRDAYWADAGNTKDSKSSSMSPGHAMSDTPLSNSQYSYSQIKLPPPVPPHAQASNDDSYDDSVFSHGNQVWTSKNSGSFREGSSSSNPYEWNTSGVPPSHARNERISNVPRNGPHNSQTSSHYGEVTNNGAVFPGDAFHPGFTSLSHHSGHSPGSHYDSLTRHRHGTSFENEHPSPISAMNKGDKYAPAFNQQRQGLHSHLGTLPGYVEMTVTLVRQESGFGFRIVGGTEEGSQVSIGHIVPGGAADLDGRLHTGDEILSVDNQIVLNTSHHRVVQLMGNAALNGRVTLGIRRRISSIDSAYHTRSTESIYPYDVTVSRRESEGFGFVIISSVSRAGSTIGRIIEGSPADRCGQLHVGDRILAVNGISILNMHHGDIVNLIKDSGYSVTLTVGPPQDDTSSTTSASQRGEEPSFDTDDQYHAVELHRGPRGFGFSIRGGREFLNMPLYVLRIAENGPAHQDGKLLVGDQIIEINGINTKNMTHSEAIELIRQGGNSVRLLVKRNSQIPPAIIDNPSPVSAPVLYNPHHTSSVTSNGHISRNYGDSASQDYYSWRYDLR